MLAAITADDVAKLPADEYLQVWLNRDLHEYVREQYPSSFRHSTDGLCWCSSRTPRRDTRNRKTVEAQLQKEFGLAVVKATTLNHK